MSLLKRFNKSNKKALLDETSLETVDILSMVFQFLELNELFTLQKVSPFFYRTIEHLKSLLIRPIYEIGLVSIDKTQLSDFLHLSLKSELVASDVKNVKNISRVTTTVNYWEANEIDMTEKNDGEQLKSVKFGDKTIHAFNKIEKEFVFKNDRFRVFFYPLYCEPNTSLSHDDYQRLDGFIFLNPNNIGVFSMPRGCSYCATVLDYNNSPIANETLNMPVRSFGSFKVEKPNERNSIEKSILDCINYISENSNRSIQLNSIGEGLKSSLLDKITAIIMEPDDNNVSTMISDLFKNRYTLKELIISEKVRYMAKKLNFFNFPHSVQFSLLKKLYTTHLGEGNVEFKDDLHLIKISFNQVFNSRIGYSDHIVETKTTLLFHLAAQEIKYEYKKLSERRADSYSDNKKCIIC